jgi:hypothetical protein
MRSFRILLLSLVLITASLSARGASKPTFRPAQFCDGEYALCITAPCPGSPVDGRISCTCDVVKGWSMGPGSCDSRKPVQKEGKTYLISTYSNLYNAPPNYLNSCTSSSQLWAWCYGATCVVDPKDPTKAVCNCPVENSPSVALGKCSSAMCTQLWSAATPAESAFANKHYYEYMQKNHPKVPVNPPATACPAGQ